MPAASDPGSPYDFSPEPYDRRQVIGATRPAPRPAPAPPPTLGPASAPPVAVASGPVAVSPAATLACPLVSVLDQWITEAVQPAAMKWFGVPVVEIKQISAYSCRGMNGDPNATISEHAFGNALDIAAFTLADGRKFDVEHGWRGSPEEQAFLHDVQGTACDQFTTVLAPGYNLFHYNHIHVDLMRRRNGRRACQPARVSGDQVAARLGFHLAAGRSDPSVTGSIGQHRAARRRSGCAPAPIRITRPTAICPTPCRARTARISCRASTFPGRSATSLDGALQTRDRCPARKFWNDPGSAVQSCALHRIREKHEGPCPAGRCGRRFPSRSRHGKMAPCSAI